jgi:hypothetical protein
MPPSPQSAIAKAPAPVCFEVLAAESNIQDDQVTCVFWTPAGGRIALRMPLACARCFSADLARRSGALPAPHERQIINGRPSGRGSTAARHEFYARLFDEFGRSRMTLTAFAASRGINQPTLSHAFIRVRERSAAQLGAPILKPGGKIL